MAGVTPKGHLFFPKIEESIVEAILLHLKK